MQRSDLEGIKRNGANAQKRGESLHLNPHYYDAGDGWMVAASAWAAGWREADGGKDEALETLDRVPYW